MKDQFHIHQQDNQMTVGECIKCQKQYESSSSESSSHSDRILIPLRRKNQISMYNDQSQIQIALMELKRQVAILKKQNTEKDKMINQLTKIIKQGQDTKIIYGQLGNNKNQIQKLKNQIKKSNYNKQYISSHHLTNHKSLEHDYMINYHNQPTYTNKEELIDKNYLKSPKSKFISKNIMTEESLPSELQFSKSLQQRLMSMEIENKWMKNFINSFIDMIEGFSKKYKQDIFIRGWSLKKKAKVSWRYLKHLVQFWLSDQ